MNKVIRTEKKKSYLVAPIYLIDNVIEYFGISNFQSDFFKVVDVPGTFYWYSVELTDKELIELSLRYGITIIDIHLNKKSFKRICDSNNKVSHRMVIDLLEYRESKQKSSIL